MGDAEKKSLPKESDPDPVVVCGEFELHCFPDITAVEPNTRRQSESDQALFKRAVPGGGDWVCGPLETAAELEADGHPLSAEEIEQIGYQRGYCEGEQKGLADGEARGLKKGRRIVGPVIETLENMLDDLARLRRQTYQRIESEIVELSLAIARKIVGHELTTSPDIVVSVIRQALSQLETAGDIRVKLNPEDLKMLTEEKASLCGGLTECGKVTFESEASIACGGCLIETDAGDIDARLETQFKAIEETFQAAMTSGQTEG